MDAIVTRKSLPLSDRDLAGLARLRESGPHRAALAELAGIDASTASEATLLRAVMDLGFTALLERVELVGYAAMAGEPDLSPDEHRAMARRRRPSWADE